MNCHERLQPGKGNKFSWATGFSLSFDYTQVLIFQEQQNARVDLSLFVCHKQR